MKYCRKCGFLKSRKDFNKSTKNKDGLHSYCRECQHKYNKQYMAVKNATTIDSDISRGIQICNSLKLFTNTELINELKLRGFTGKLIMKTEIEL